ncbi:MAG: glycosyltransferase [Clostridium sp.]|nr:glycosyltransferase [Clostridium sp.]
MIKGVKQVQINTVCNASTGRLMGDIQREALRQGYQAISYVGRRRVYPDMPCEKFGNPISFWNHVAINTVFDRQGYGSFFPTKKLIKKLERENPDIIHLHNLHGYYLNIPLLFRYLKQDFAGRLFWTFHDCWPFTGHCPYFTMAGCEKWKEHCHHCPKKRSYPISLFFDASRRNYKDKKEMFGSLPNLTIITPSMWMAELVQDSFMGKYPVRIIPNGVDLETFSYVGDRGICRKYKIPEDKKILLGVANIWDKRKGLNDFQELAKILPEEYRILLVGLSKIQIRKMPENVIGIERTENQRELAALYSLAEIFINPSLEESFSLVTVEAFACGTPVIVLNTSAVGELVNKENGIVLNGHSAKEYLEAVKKLEKMGLDRKKVAMTAEKYEHNRTAKQIVNLYKEC